MNNFYEVLPVIGHYLDKIIGSFQCIIVISLASLLIKGFIFFILLSRISKSNFLKKPFFLIFLIIIGSMINDIVWILTLLRELSIINIEYQYLRFITRIAWSFYIIYYHSIALFIEELSERNSKLGIHQKIFLAISSAISVFFIILAFYQFDCTCPSMRPQIEISLLTFSPIYFSLFLMPINIISATIKFRTQNIPRILKRQLKFFIQFIALPIMIADLVQTYPFTFITSSLANTFTTIGLSSILVTYGIFHCMQKIMNIRFLNLENHVQAQDHTKKFYFIDDFKDVLEKFSLASNNNDLENITKEFFKNAFNIPINRTRLYIKTINKHSESSESSYINNTDELTIDNFISSYDSKTKIGNFITKNKIIITDELAFNNFYEEDQNNKKLLCLMEKISADIFIPIFEPDSAQAINTSSSDRHFTKKYALCGYIIIEKNARINEENKNAPFYSNVERDQMLVYANYLGNIIKLFQTRSIISIIEQEKTLKEEIIKKQKESLKQRECLEFFLRNNSNKKVGVIYYKNKKFELENQAANDIIPVKLNMHDGHPITKKLKELATAAINTKVQQKCFIVDKFDNPVLITAIPSKDKNFATIILTYPEISDFLDKKIELLKDPKKTCLIAYLDTTEAGKIINRFAPINTETTINFKVDLFNICLTPAAKLLLNNQIVENKNANNDLTKIVDIIIKISDKTNAFSIDAKEETDKLKTTIDLFGINPILNQNKSEKKPVLEELNNTGTLFIKNIEYLDQEAQANIKNFIKYGYFKVFRSEKKIFSNVNIICSSNLTLSELENCKTMDNELLNQLSKNSLSIPKLKDLSKDDLEKLIDSYAEQEVKSQELQSILELSESEKKKIINSSIESFSELKNCVTQAIIKKSNKNKIYTPAKIEPKIEISSGPETERDILEAIKLGKNALKDIKIMSLLWNKYKNQNKIASLLGVNRSSINRRCKEYKLL